MTQLFTHRVLNGFEVIFSDGEWPEFYKNSNFAVLTILTIFLLQDKNYWNKKKQDRSYFDPKARRVKTASKRIKSIQKFDPKITHKISRKNAFDVAP